MAKEVLIQAWDDLDLRQDGAKVPADMAVRLDVAVLNADGQVVEAADVELDLTGDHAAAFWSGIRPWVDAGTPVSRAAKTPAAATAHAATGKKKVTPPLEKLCPFAPGTAARRAWLDDLREWAAGEGREVEYHQPGWDGEPSTKYHYPKRLITDFISRPGYDEQRYLLQKAS